MRSALTFVVLVQARDADTEAFDPRRTLCCASGLRRGGSGWADVHWLRGWYRLPTISECRTIYVDSQLVH
jgi:hypothetical protein